MPICTSFGKSPAAPDRSSGTLPGAGAPFSERSRSLVYPPPNPAPKYGSNVVVPTAMRPVMDGTCRNTSATESGKRAEKVTRVVDSERNPLQKEDSPERSAAREGWVARPTTRAATSAKTCLGVPQPRLAISTTFEREFASHLKRQAIALPAPSGDKNARVWLSPAPIEGGRQISHPRSSGKPSLRFSSRRPTETAPPCGNDKLQEVCRMMAQGSWARPGDTARVFHGAAQQGLPSPLPDRLWLTY